MHNHLTVPRSWRTRANASVNPPVAGRTDRRRFPLLFTSASCCRTTPAPLTGIQAVMGQQPEQLIFRPRAPLQATQERPIPRRNLDRISMHGVPPQDLSLRGTVHAPPPLATDPASSL